MKKIIFILTILSTSIGFAQTLEQIQGKWRLVDVEFSGADSDYLNKEENKPPCLEKAAIEFDLNKMKTISFYGENCSENESEVFPFTLEKSTLKVYEEIEKVWQIVTIENFTPNSFTLIYEEDKDLKIKVSFEKI